VSGSDDFTLPPDFDGVVRLFPLPNLVLFPGVMQPLHIFESRYQEMLEDALDSDRLIAMSLLQPGWESEYNSRPPIWPTVCLGRVVTHSRDEQGRSNILLLGIIRAQVAQEMAPERSYRLAEVRPLNDEYPVAVDSNRSVLQHDLLAAFRRRAQVESAEQMMDQLLATEAPLGVLTDIIAYTIDVSIEEKMELLADTNVDARARRLIDLLDQAGPQRPFPPQVSDN